MNDVIEYYNQQSLDYVLELYILTGFINYSGLEQKFSYYNDTKKLKKHESILAEVEIFALLYIKYFLKSRFKKYEKNINNILNYKKYLDQILKFNHE